MNQILAILLLITPLLAQEGKGDPHLDPFANPVDDPALPRVLIILDLAIGIV